MRVGSTVSEPFVVMCDYCGQTISRAVYRYGQCVWGQLYLSRSLLCVTTVDKLSAQLFTVIGNACGRIMLSMQFPLLVVRVGSIVKPCFHMIALDRRIAENIASDRQRLYGNTFQRSGDCQRLYGNTFQRSGDRERSYASVIPVIRRS